MRGHFQDKGRLSKFSVLLIICVFNYCSWSIAETYRDMIFFLQKFAENQLRYCNRDYKESFFFFKVKIVLLARAKRIFVMIM